MGQPAAKQGDRVVGIDTHIVLVPSPSGAVPTPMPIAFSGEISSQLSERVLIDEQQAATKGSRASNSPAHVPTGGTFQKEPSNEAEIDEGSATVFIDDKPAARLGDAARTCNDPVDADRGRVVASSTVIVG